jgi:Ca-activated chloride channel family protein
MIDELSFDNNQALHLLWAIPALATLIGYGFWRKGLALRTLASSDLLPHLVPSLSRTRQVLKAALFLAALTALTLAAVGPRWGLKYEDVRRRGLDIIFALDVSRSMLAEDLAPNRLERAKQYIRDMIDVVGGDRVGLLTFAGDAVVNCPLTIDFGSFRMSLNEVHTRSTHRGGTLLGDAIRKATESFVDPIKQHKAIVVITDGEDHESFPIEAATQAREELGIRVYTIGLGDSSDGRRIPIERNGQRSFLTHDGQEVWSRMDGAALAAIAQAGDGAYVPAGLLQIDMADFYQKHISAADQRDFEANQVERREAQFQWFAGVALALLLAEMTLAERRRGALSPGTNPHPG